MDLSQKYISDMPYNTYIRFVDIPDHLFHGILDMLEKNDNPCYSLLLGENGDFIKVPKKSES